MEDDRQPQSAVMEDGRDYRLRCYKCGTRVNYSSIIEREDGSCYRETICSECEMSRRFDEGGVLRDRCEYCGELATHIILYSDHINVVRDPVVCPCCMDYHRQVMRRSPRFGYVYLLNSLIGYYKIGRSAVPVERVRKLDVVLPFELKVEALIETADMHRLEKELQTRFSEYRIRGEWFALDEQHVLFIKRMVVQS
jgi:hypothetical protein